MSKLEHLHSFDNARHQVLPIVVKCGGLDQTRMLHIDHLVHLVHLLYSVFRLHFRLRLSLQTGGPSLGRAFGAEADGDREPQPHYSFKY